MSSEVPNLPTDAQFLYEYLGQQLHSDAPIAGGKEVLADLAAYQAQLERLRSLVKEGEASLGAGEGRELDVEALIRRVESRSSSAGDS